MIDLRNKRCVVKGCQGGRSYFLPGESALYCELHKTDAMSRRRYNKCEDPLCQKIRTFGEPGGRTQFCASHAPPAFVDVVSPRCQYDDCGAYNPAYGMQGEERQFCRVSAEPGNVNLVYLAKEKRLAGKL